MTIMCLNYQSFIDPNNINLADAARQHISGELASLLLLSRDIKILIFPNISHLLIAETSDISTSPSCYGSQWTFTTALAQNLIDPAKNGSMLGGFSTNVIVSDNPDTGVSTLLVEERIIYNSTGT
jgi:hypothetical protein